MSHQHIASGSVTSPILSHNSESISNSAIYFYREHRPEHTCTLNVNDFSKSIIQIHSQEFSQKQFLILCGLPNNKVLCFCHHKDQGFFFSLDSHGNVFQFKKPSRKEKPKSLAVYYKNDIVFILGCDRWYKLDTYRNIYFTISGESRDVYYSCTLLNDFIIISMDRNIHTFIVYDILTNSRSIMECPQKGGAKHLFTFQESLYAIDSDGYLYLYGLWDWNEWKFMGFIKRWTIDKFSYWLYYNNNVYVMTGNQDMIKFELKHHKIDAEISQINPTAIREIHRLDRSMIFEEVLKSILPSWKDLLSPTMIDTINKIWNLIVLMKQNLGIFPTILNKNPEKWFDKLEVDEKSNYFFEIFRKNPWSIKIIIFISMRKKKKIINYDKLIEKITMISRSLELDHNWIELRNDIIVLSPLVTFTKITSENSNKFNGFMVETIHILNSILNKAVFMLWGKEARKLSASIDHSKHLVIPNVSLLSENEVKVKAFKNSKQFQSAYSFFRH